MNLKLPNFVYAGRKAIPQRTRQIKPIEIKIGSETVRLKFGVEGCDVLVKSQNAAPTIKGANLIDRARGCTQFISYPYTWGKYVEDAEGDYCRLKRFLKPQTLPVVDYTERTFHISNFYNPCGTIAIASTLDKTISTDELCQCAAMAIVDREQNLQVLMHCCPYKNAVENRAILEYIMSHFKKSSPEITFVPGRFHESGQAIQFCIDNIADIMGKEFPVKFAQVPERKYDFIGLRNGELGCSTKKPDEIDINNPDKIIFSSIADDVVNGKLIHKDTVIKSSVSYFAYNGKWRKMVKDVYYDINS